MRNPARAGFLDFSIDRAPTRINRREPLVLMPSNTKFTPEAQISIFALVIERTVTDNFLDDQPWPPPGERWQLIHASKTTSRWRRINLKT
jgi:hypothetical protein